MKEYISYSDALKLRDLGFNEKTQKYYNDNGELFTAYTTSFTTNAGIKNRSDIEHFGNYFCSAPTYYQAYTWLLVKNEHIEHTNDLNKIEYAVDTFMKHISNIKKNQKMTSYPGYFGNKDGSKYLKKLKSIGYDIDSVFGTSSQHFYCACPDGKVHSFLNEEGNFLVDYGFCHLMDKIFDITDAQFGDRYECNSGEVIIFHHKKNDKYYFITGEVDNTNITVREYDEFGIYIPTADEDDSESLGNNISKKI